MAEDSGTVGIEVFSRPGCHLCEKLIEELQPMIRGRLPLRIRNIDTSDDWLDRYELKIPVVVYAGHEVCHFHLDRTAIGRLLSKIET